MSQQSYAQFREWETGGTYYASTKGGYYTKTAKVEVSYTQYEHGGIDGKSVRATGLYIMEWENNKEIEVYYPLPNQDCMYSKIIDKYMELSVNFKGDDYYFKIPHDPH